MPASRGVSAAENRPQPEELASVRVVGGYRLERPLGSGGTARVWLGRHETTGGLAAVKLMHEERAEAARELFENERRALLRLRHPNIIPVFDVGEDYIATAYIEGVDLRHRMRAPMAPADAIEIVCAVGSALGSAHAAGVVHCDVKPANILLDQSDNPFLADFGISHLLGEEDLQESDYVAGTPAFMAPEQAMGELTPAADQYALARTLLSMLVGRGLPKDSDRALDLLDPEVGNELHAVLQRGLAYEPEDRFPDVGAFVHALRGVEVPASARSDRIATLARKPEPFRWVAAPSQVERVGEHIVVARYRLSELVASGLLDAAAFERFVEATGHQDFGWSMFAREERLGPLTEPTSLARVRECVVLTHGLFTHRDLWRDVAIGIARDNGMAVALTPDILGFGESTFLPHAPTEACSPRGSARALRDWRALIGLGTTPTVMLGHSFSAGALLCVRDEDLGGEVRRVAVTPALFSGSVFLRLWALGYYLIGMMFSWLPMVLMRPMARFFFRRDPSLQNIHVGARDEMAASACTLGWSRAARLFLTLSRANPAPAQELANCILVTTPDDPLVSGDIVERTVAEAGLPASQRFRLYYGGHFPQLVDDEHPEWGARNVHELVSVVDSVLDMKRSGSVRDSPSGSDSHSAPGQLTTRTSRAPSDLW